MSINGIHWARNSYGPTMCPYRKALLFALGERHNVDTGLCIPDQQMLARDAGMSERTVRKYLKILESEGFIERRVISRGVGRQTHYILHFDVLEARSVGTNRHPRSGTNRQDTPVGPTGTPVPAPTGTPVPAPTGTLAPVHKEHEVYPKSTRTLLSDETSDERSVPKKKSRREPVNDTDTLQAFEKLWQLWPKQGRERSRSKATVLDQLRRASKSKPVAAILAAGQAFVAKTEPKFVPGLDRWLQQGRYEHFLPPDLAARAAGVDPEPPKLASDGIDWPAMVARWWRSGIWPNRLGDRPDEIDYRGPLAPVEAILANGKIGDPRIVRLKRNLDFLKARSVQPSSPRKTA